MFVNALSFIASTVRENATALLHNNLTLLYTVTVLSACYQCSCFHSVPSYANDDTEDLQW